MPALEKTSVIFSGAYGMSYCWTNTPPNYYFCRTSPQSDCWNIKTHFLFHHSRKSNSSIIRSNMRDIQKERTSISPIKHYWLSSLWFVYGADMCNRVSLTKFLKKKWSQMAPQHHMRGPVQLRLLMVGGPCYRLCSETKEPRLMLLLWSIKCVELVKHTAVAVDSCHDLCRQRPIWRNIR